MDILIRAARIVDTGSPFHNQVKDLLIRKGIIEKIGSKLPLPPKTKEVRFSNLHVSNGWVDMNARFGEPGLEQKETLETGMQAARQGGYTHVCLMPNTQPVVQTKAQIDFIKSACNGKAVNLLPVGALTLNNEGKELAELLDMHHAGAVAFSDGLVPSPPAGVVERALQYLTAVGALLLLHPEDKSISKNGVMHEGITGTLLGLPGMPAEAETIAVNRDLFVLEYTNGRLHFLDISLKKSAEMIKAAKKKGLRVSCSVNAANLLLDDKSVGSYDTHCKVNPPLRPKEETQGLLKAISEGVIDTVTSAHQPQEEDCKKLEFDKADFGMIGLETAFAAASTALEGKIDTTQLIDLFTTNARTLLGLNKGIQEGGQADLTLFDPGLQWTFTTGHIRSKSKNTPFVGQSFKGKALATYVKGIYHTTN